MLKRSFLEFHAQKAAPEALIAVEKGRAALARLRARPWPASAAGATRDEVERYCEVGARIEELSAELQVRWRLGPCDLRTGWACSSGRHSCLCKLMKRTTPRPDGG